MSRIEEVNSSVVLMLKLYDGRTDRYVRARVYNSSAVEVSGSPFALTHDTNGRYRSTGWTPTTEGQYTVDYVVYTDAGFTNLDPRYNQVVEQVDIRSIDQDLATLLSRLTATRAGYLDNLPRLDVVVSTRATPAQAAVAVWDELRAPHTVSGSFGETVRLNNTGLADDTISAPKIATDAITSGKIAADAIGASELATSAVEEIVSAVWNEPQAIHSVPGSFGLFLDTTVSSRESDTQASLRYSQVRTDIAGVQADTDDLQTKIGIPASTVSGDIAAVKAQTNAIETDTQDIQSKIGTPVSTLAGDLASIQSDTDDIQAKIGSPTSTLAGDIAVIDGNVDAVKAKTDQLNFTGTNVNANTQVNSDKTGYELTGGERVAVGGAVWDTERTGHTNPDTFGLFLDTQISTRESEGDASSRYGNVVSDIAGVKADTDDIQAKIGSPVGTLASDIAGVQADTDDIQSKIGTPSDTLALRIAGVQADTDDLQLKIGTPAGASVSADIAAVKADSAAIKLKTDRLQFTGTNSVFSEVTGLTLNPADLQTIADAVWESQTTLHDNPGTFGEAVNHAHEDVEIIIARLGVPVGATFSADLASVQADTNDLQSKLGTPVSTVSGDIAQVQSDTDDIQSKIGTPVSTVSGDIAAVKAQTGAIETDTQDIQSRIGTPVGTLSSDIASVQADTDSIETKVDGIKAQTDQFTFTGPNVNARTKFNDDKTGYSLSPAELALWAARVWDELKVSHNVVGSFGALLDVAVSSRQSEASALSRYTQVRSDIAGVQADTDDLQTKIGSPFATVSADIAGVKSDVAAVKGDTSTLTSRLTATRAGYLDNLANLSYLDAPVSSRQPSAVALVQYNDLKGILLNTVDARVLQVLATLGSPFGGSVATALAAIKAMTDRIGVPANGTLAQDNITAYTELLKIGAPFSPSLAGDLLAIYSRLGAPTGASLAADVAEVKADTSVIGTPTSGSLADDHDAILSRIGLPVSGSLSGDVAVVGGSIGNLNTKIGTPANGTIAADIAEVEGQTDSLRTDITPLRAANLDNLNATVGSRQPISTAQTQYDAVMLGIQAILSSIGAIPNNTTFVGVVPQALILPEPPLASKTYKFYANLFDQTGLPTDPDGNLMTVHIEDAAGNVVVGNTSMTRADVGQYLFNYPVLAGDPERVLFVIFDYIQGGTPYRQIRIAEVQEFESKLDTLLSRLTPTRASNLDRLDTTVSSRQSTADGLAQYLDLVARCTLLGDGLSTLSTVLGTPTTTIAGDISVIRFFMDRLGIPVSGTLAGDIASVKSDTNRIGTPLGGSVASALQTLINRLGVPNTTLAGDLATLLTLPSRIGYTSGGSVETGIAEVRSKLGTLVGTDLETLIRAIDLTAVMARLGVPVSGSLALDIASVLARIGVPPGGTVATGFNLLSSAISATQAAVDETLTRLGVPSTTVADELATLLAGSSAGDLKLDALLGEVGNLGTSLTDIAARVDALPTNPVLVTDPRLTLLDAPISSRATPADCSGGGGGGGTGTTGSIELIGIMESDGELVG